MLTEREKRKVALERAVKKQVTSLRSRWLKQVLGWPLKGGPLTERLTKAEAAALAKAAKQGKLFC
jgi:hypothetical protein